MAPGRLRVSSSYDSPGQQMTDMQRSLFCFGLGYSALHLARTLKTRGWEVSGTVRSASKVERLREEGINASVWPDGTPDIPSGAVWLVSVPPDETGCPVARTFGGIAAGVPVIYLSTTGVYGDRNGNWVFEWSAPSPDNPRGERRWLAEEQWQAAAGTKLARVRLPGIYGPGRSALDRLHAGRARRIIKPGQVFSRVHVEDIASGLSALLMKGVPAGVFHLCDDEPAPPQEVIEFAARLAGLEVPPAVRFDAADLSPMARSFYSECKRVSNAKTKGALGWRPIYPTYREGLTAILANETA